MQLKTLASALVTREAPHFLYIDCVRGYAILMVITCHLTNHYAGLPYPVHRLTVTGWYGVQLFFLASCVTLMMSWHYEVTKNDKADTIGFFIRRFFRIAPAYYAAGILYYVFAPPMRGFDVWHAIASATFINAWSPTWTPTVPTEWNVVPGGWSISVEFTFYFLFPLFAAKVTTLRRAILVAIGAIVIGVLANRVAYAILIGSYRTEEIENFLFFWFPNEMSVFALGGILFFLLHRVAHSDLTEWLRKYATPFQASAAATFCALAYLPLGHYLGTTPWIPASLVVTMVFMGLVITLSVNRGLLVNRYAAAMGKVSFSAYLLHWMVLQIFEKFPETLHTHAVDFSAIFYFVVGWIIAVSVTYIVSLVSYRIIEAPLMRVGKIFARNRSGSKIAAPLTI